jgi:hypothetical protein
MRIPNSSFHEITFNLIEYVNRHSTEEYRLKLIPYILSAPGNDIFINGRFHLPTNATAYTIWGLEKQSDGDHHKNAAAIMKRALAEPVRQLQEAMEEGEDQFEKAFRSIMEKYDSLSFRDYLIQNASIAPIIVDFMETVLSQTNQFALSFPACLLQNLDFETGDWKTIDQGMSRLPRAMEKLIGRDKITRGARLMRIEERGNIVGLTLQGERERIYPWFHKVVLAIPPAALKMLISRPRWSPMKEVSIRATHVVPLYKMGLRFKRRFWEDPKLLPPDIPQTLNSPPIHPGPTRGGQSTTDLPIRWIVFPSYGLGEEGGHTKAGVLVVYTW